MTKAKPKVSPSKLSQDQSTAITIHKATVKYVPQVAILFDKYRQFYDEKPDLELAETYISDRIKKRKSTIFLALDNQGKALGFTQLYNSFCSVEAGPICVLYDLHIEQYARQLGVGKMLMTQAKDYATSVCARRIDLETAMDNLSAQGLYEQLGYARDQAFYKYSLEL